jgi:2-keto-4-pentenoate hydratase/2-oxohepta-3-ene-1,7-dioic acid hydratase in catechol pathway
VKLVTYDLGAAARAGLWLDDLVADLEKAGRAAGVRLPASTRELLAGGESVMAAARKAAALAGRVARDVIAGKARRPGWLLPEEHVHLGPPVPDPQKIVCVGLNYIDHCREQEGRLGRAVEPPKIPVLFAKYPSALAGPFDPIRLPSKRISEKVDYEVELTAVIGRRAKGVAKRDAMAHVAGYMVANDVSARDCQFADKQWTRAKSFDSFCPCGPWLITADEVPAPHRLKLWTVLNGQTMQSGTTRDMIHKLPALVSFASQAITLEPGDLILTGTPAGVGIFRDPPVMLAPGDVVEQGVQGVGTICNPVERA